MRSHSRGKRISIALCVLFTLTPWACAHLDPPRQATSEQAAEREQESATPNIIQVRTERGSEHCAVTFDDPLALGQIYRFAKDSFAWRTGQSSSGQLEHCDPSRHGDCWIYRQRCTRHEVNVDAVTWGHFHLGFETGGTCFMLDAGDGLGPAFGRPVDGTCTGVSWISERRILYSHMSNHWIKIWVRNTTSRTPTYFDMESVWVLPGKPIQLWFRKRDGTWWFWPELRTGTIWNTRDWIRDVSEVRINSAVPLGDDIYVIGGFGVRD